MTEIRERHVKSRFNSSFRPDSAGLAKKEMIQTELAKMHELAHPTPKPKKKEGRKRPSDSNLIDAAANWGRAAALVTILGSGVQPVAAGELSSPPPSPSSGHELTMKQPSKDILEQSGFMIEASKPITETYANLLVTEEWLKENPIDIAARFDVNDQNGNPLEKLVVVRRDVDGQNTNFEHTLYKSPYNQTEQKYSAEYKPISKIPIGNVLSMTALDNGRILYFGGETPTRTTATDLRRSSDYGKSVGQNLWQSTSYSSVSGPVIDLIPINETTVYGNLGNSETGGMQIIIYDNLNTNTPNIQAIKTESISATNLKSAGAPEITASYSLTNTIEVTSSAFERGLERGVDKSSINYQNATGTTENFLANEVGYVIGITQYQDSSGKHGLVTDADFSYRIRGYDIDANGEPVSPINYSIDASRWLNNKNIPNFIPNSLTPRALFAGVDSQNNVHVWVFGFYSVERSDGIPGGTSHAIIGHYIKGTDPNTDQNALFWKDLGPFDTNKYIGGPSQRQLQFKIVNEQTGFEYPVDGDNFGGMEFYPINRDFSPDPNAEIVRPNKGLQQRLQDLFKVYIPALFKNLTGWSW